MQARGGGNVPDEGGASASGKGAEMWAWGLRAVPVGVEGEVRAMRVVLLVDLLFLSPTVAMYL